MIGDKRLNELEIIDLGPNHYSIEEYRDCLRQLDRIGRYLGGDKATYWAFNQLKQKPQSILDVGCGGGLFTMRLAQKYPASTVMGIDISEEAILFANQHLEKLQFPLKNVKFSIPQTPQLSYPANSVDVVTSTLVCHHLPDEILIDFLKRAYSTAIQAIILNDLHRHHLATLTFSTIASLFFPNRLIKNDGRISIQRAFTKKEWIAYLIAAGIPLHQCSITWHWAFRWIVIIQKPLNRKDF